MNDLHAEAGALRKEAVRIRRDLHKHPELGFQETRTAGIVADALERLNLKVETGVGGTGVVGLLKGAGSGRTVLIRADMDALPILEESDIPYASTVPGVMHACGHDGHTAMGLMAALLLAGRRDRIDGSVVFVFQPAEEELGGARAMIDDGVLDRHRPDVALALHLWNSEEVGRAAVTPGPVLASADMFRIRLSGRGGHGAMPHLADDVITAACQVHTSLQTIVSRSVDPMKTAVVSVGHFHAGEAPNVLPGRADLSGTIRTFDRDVRNRVIKRMEEIIHHVSSAFGVDHELTVEEGVPPVVNDGEVTLRMQEVAREMLGADAVDTDHRIMPSEDMALFLNEVPGCFVFVGSGNPRSGLDFPHHHPRFDFDEDVLTVGIELLARGALRCLED